MNKTCASSFNCTFTVAVSTVIGFLVLLKISFYLSLNLTCSALSLEARESTTNDLLCFWRSFYIRFQADRNFSPNSTLLCCHNLHVVKFPQTGRAKILVMKFTSSENDSRLSFSLPNFRFVPSES